MTENLNNIDWLFLYISKQIVIYKNNIDVFVYII